MDVEGSGSDSGISANNKIILGIVIFLIALFLILIPTKTIYEDIQVSYNETITYTETEPYTERIAVSPTISFFSQIQSYNFQGEGCRSGCTCDTYHYSGYTKICTYCICPTFKPAPAPEYKTVVKFRDVTKTRNETRTKIEKRPLEVNWIFGFRTPYTLHLLPGTTSPVTNGTQASPAVAPAKERGILRWLADACHANPVCNMVIPS